MLLGVRSGVWHFASYRVFRYVIRKQHPNPLQPLFQKFDFSHFHECLLQNVPVASSCCDGTEINSDISSQLTNMVLVILHFQTQVVS